MVQFNDNITRYLRYFKFGKKLAKEGLCLVSIFVLRSLYAVATVLLIFPATCGVIILMVAGAQSVAKQPTCGSLPPPSYSSHTPQSAGNRGGGLVTHGYHNWPSDVDNHGSLGCVQYVLPTNTQYIVCVGGQKYTILVSLASIIHPLQRLGKSHAHTRKRLPTNKLLQSR